MVPVVQEVHPVAPDKGFQARVDPVDRVDPGVKTDREALDRAVLVVREGLVVAARALDRLA